MQPYEQQPYRHDHAPQQQPMYAPQPHALPRQRSQGLAITTLVLGVVAIVTAFTPVRGLALVVGLIAAILAAIALIAKSQGGKRFAAAGLTLGMASLPLAYVLYTAAQAQSRSNEQSVQCMTDAMEKGKSVDEIWAC